MDYGLFSGKISGHISYIQHVKFFDLQEKEYIPITIAESVFIVTL